MRWIARKFDSLVGAMFAAVGGVLSSQFPAFIIQYLQRLGGHLDEARLNLHEVQVSERFQMIDASARHLLEQAAQDRVHTIQTAYDAIRTAGPFGRTLAFVENVDLDIARRVASDFQPVVPIDVAGLVYAGVGMIIGLAVYEFVKAPVAVGRRLGRSAR